jgi:hypothetical protein
MSARGTNVNLARDNGFEGPRVFPSSFASRTV